VLGFVLTAKIGLELAVFTAHQKTHQHPKDEPYEQGEQNLWHDISFDSGYILYEDDT
jgi:hypothetical protein